MAGADSNHQPLFAVVVVHWGSFENTAGCLKSLSEVTYPCLQVLVVDNDSPTFDPERAYQVLQDVQIVHAPTNLGFAGGCNLGLHEGMKTDAAFFMLLNNDAFVQPDIIQEMLPIFADPTIGIAGPLVTAADDPSRIVFGGGRYSQFLGTAFRRQRIGQLHTLVDVNFVSGSALLMRRVVWEQLDGLWEELFLYFEETDFCLRARAAGWRCVVMNTPLVRHRASASTGYADRAYYLARNALHMIRRHGKRLNRLSAYLFQFILVLPFWIAHSIVTGKANIIPHYILGMRDGFRSQMGRRPI